MRSEFFKKIIWAVDTLEAPEFHRGALSILGALTRATRASVDPVHILSPPYTAINIPYSTPAASLNDFDQAFQALAEKRMFEFARASDIPTMSAGKVLLNHLPSVSSGVQRIIDYGEKENADVIVVSTHARKGASRFFMGSFAETLILKSPVPVITVNPETKVRERIAKILLPTTFQSNFRAGFEKVAQLAKILDSRLTVYYKEPAIPSAYMSPLVWDAMAKDAVVRKERAKEWQEWAAQFHLPVDIHIDNEPGSVVNSIEAFAHNNDFDLIAMVSQAGSTARQVVRSAPCPVWIVRAEEEELP